MSSGNVLTDSAIRGFQKLYTSVREGIVRYTDAIQSVPLSVFQLIAGTPGRIGYALARQMRNTTPDTMLPGQLIESLAWAVTALIEQAHRIDKPELRASIELQWRILRGTIMVEFAPGKQRRWMKQLARREEVVGLIIDALEAGAQYNDGHWEQDEWEGGATTEQIIEWFEQCLQQPDSTNS